MKTEIAVAEMHTQTNLIKKIEKIFSRSFGVAKILPNKMYCFTKLSNAKLWNEKGQQTEKGHQEIGVLYISCYLQMEKFPSVKNINNYIYTN